jgi:hypothetical protein
VSASASCCSSGSLGKGNLPFLRHSVTCFSEIAFAFFCMAFGIFGPFASLVDHVSGTVSGPYTHPLTAASILFGAYFILFFETGLGPLGRTYAPAVFFGIAVQRLLEINVPAWPPVIGNVAAGAGLDALGLHGAVSYQSALMIIAMACFQMSLGRNWFVAFASLTALVLLVSLFWLIDQAFPSETTQLSVFHSQVSRFARWVCLSSTSNIPDAPERCRVQECCTPGGRLRTHRAAPACQRQTESSPRHCRRAGWSCRPRPPGPEHRAPNTGPQTPGPEHQD